MLGPHSFLHSFGFSTEELAAIIRSAGQEITRIYAQEDHQVSFKNDQSPVTAADIASHRLLSQKLAQLTPQVSVLSEESSLNELDLAAFMRKADAFWLIDPLDGTKDFINRTDEFCVNIAFIFKGKCVLGYVYIPVQDVLYCAGEGYGAWSMNYRTGTLQKIQVASGQDAGTKNLRCFISRFHSSIDQQRLAAVFPNADITPVGSAYKYCLLAEGKADFIARWSDTKLWDTAAPQIIVEEAGGKMVDFRGNPLVYGRRTLTNPYFMVSARQELIEKFIDHNTAAEP